MKKKTLKNDEAKVDVTPLLDIVFIMLIFFIVSSTFIRENGMDVSEQKQNENQETTNAKAIFVHVCANDTVIIDKRLIDVRSVRANVERKLVEDSRAAVVIESEKGAPTGNLVKVIDQAKAAKASFSIVSTGTSCHQAMSA